MIYNIIGKPTRLFFRQYVIIYYYYVFQRHRNFAITRCTYYYCIRVFMHLHLFVLFFRLCNAQLFYCNRKRVIRYSFVRKLVCPVGKFHNNKLVLFMRTTKMCVGLLRRVGLRAFYTRTFQYNYLRAIFI